MRALIDRQQVGRRVSERRQEHYPLVVRMQGELTRVRREARAVSQIRQAPVAVVQTPSRPARALGVRSARTVLSAAVVLLLIVGIIGVAVGASPRTAKLPKEGPALPKDHELAAALASYGGLAAAGGAAAASTLKAADARKVPLPPIKVFKSLRTETYRVKRGDTVSGIARAFGINDQTLISFNKISDVRSIMPGTVLKVPNMDGVLYDVKRGDTLGGIAKAYDIKLTTVLDANNLASSTIFPSEAIFLPNAHMSAFAYRKALGTLFVWPTHGVITSPFGMRHDPFTGLLTFHNGIDIANVIGTPIRAVMAGRVAYLGENRGYGKFILIDHGDGYQSLYAHLSKRLVTRGEEVGTGQVIARMGDTGYSTGPHLHFTIYKKGVPINPLTVLSRG